jgi:heme exporter protein A
VDAIEVDGVTFSFGSLRVLNGISLRLVPGTVLTMFGPNGAGKTTLLKLVAGLLRPASGRIRIEGMEVGEDPLEVRRRIGVISHHPYLYPQLTGLENLVYYGRLYGLKDAKSEAQVLLEDMGLAPVMHREVSTYSRGTVQRLAVARALLHRPSVLLLDEPFTGLDYQAGQKLEQLLGSLRDGRRTVIMTTHDIDGGLNLSDRVAILAGGTIAAELPTAGLDRSTFLETYRQTVGAKAAPHTERSRS